MASVCPICLTVLFGLRTRVHCELRINGRRARGRAKVAHKVVADIQRFAVKQFPVKRLCNVGGAGVQDR